MTTGRLPEVERPACHTSLEPSYISERKCTEWGMKSEGFALSKNHPYQQRGEVGGVTSGLTLSARVRAETSRRPHVGRGTRELSTESETETERAFSKIGQT